MKTTFHNPALREEPRNQPIKVAPLAAQESLLVWLENTGRLRSSEIDELQDHRMPEDLNDILDPEIYALENEEEQSD